MNPELFFRTVTRRTLRPWVRVVVLLLILATLPLLAFLLPSYLIETDIPGRGQTIVIENWEANVELFELAGNAADSLQPAEIWLTAFEDTYRSDRRRTGMLVNAWAAGIDTTRIRFAVGRRVGRKTLGTAVAAIDSAQTHGLSRITLVTSLFHSGRSGKIFKHYAAQKGITVDVVGLPHLGITGENWMKSSTGVSLVALEMLKKLYYDLFVSFPDEELPRPS